MDIYILRDGKETGPYSEPATQLLLKQGGVAITDLAWQPGMAEWIPLHSVLYPAPAAAVTAPPPPPAAVVPVAASEPASARQKAFLSYMGIAFPADLAKDHASYLVNEAMEDSANGARLSRWNDDRLRLHPELFAAELQAKKDGRAVRFYEQVQGEGAECFEGVGKAHCQVLVGYLDVKFPNWDAREAEATWNYFFPALAEKFPQLVKREWKDKLKYPDGPKVAPELHRRGPVKVKRRGSSPVAALAKGLVFGVVLLGIAGGGWYVWQHPELVRPFVKAIRDAGAKPGNVAAVKPTPTPTPPAVEAPKPVVASPVSTPAAEPPPAATGEPAMVAATPPAAVPAETMAPPMSGGIPLFDPGATTPPAPSSLFAPGAPGMAAPVAPAPKTSVVLTKPVDVKLAFGSIKIPVGTALKLVAQDGAMVRVNFQNSVISIPASSTDLGAEAPPAP